MSLESGLVWMWDDTGRRRELRSVSVNDVIEWKRNGTVGLFRCRVLGIESRPAKTPRLRVLLLEHDGMELDRYVYRWISAGISRVINSPKVAPIKQGARK